MMGPKTKANPDLLPAGLNDLASVLRMIAKPKEFQAALDTISAVIQEADAAVARRCKVEAIDKVESEVAILRKAAESVVAEAESKAAEILQAARDEYAGQAREVASAITTLNESKKAFDKSVRATSSDMDERAADVNAREKRLAGIEAPLANRERAVVAAEAEIKRKAALLAQL